jgi:hypothetical protein
MSHLPWLDDPQIGEVAEALVEIEAISDDILITDDLADIPQLDWEKALRAAIEQRADIDRPSSAFGEEPVDIGDGEAPVDDVHREHDCAPGDVLVEVLRQTDALASGAVRRQAQEINRARDLEPTRKVGHKADAALQYADENETVRVIP